jgi:hypothetical protein
MRKRTSKAIDPAMAGFDLRPLLRVAGRRKKPAKRTLLGALGELRHRYHCGLGGGNCDGDYDFGYESGLDSACKSVVEDLDRLIAEFFPKAGKECARPARRSGKATAQG